MTEQGKIEAAYRHGFAHGFETALNSWELLSYIKKSLGERKRRLSLRGFIRVLMDWEQGGEGTSPPLIEYYDLKIDKDPGIYTWTKK